MHGDILLEGAVFISCVLVDRKGYNQCGKMSTTRPEDAGLSISTNANAVLSSIGFGWKR